MYVAYDAFTDTHVPRNYYRSQDDLLKHYKSLENYCIANINHALAEYNAYEDNADVFNKWPTRKPERSRIRRLDAIRENILYYYGLQDNTPIIPFYDNDGNIVPFIRSKKLRQIIDRVLSFVNEFIYRTEVYAQSLSFETKSAKEIAVLIYKARRDMPELFDAIAEQTGYNIPLPNEILSGMITPEDFVNDNIKTMHERIGDKIIRYFTEYYNLRYLFNYAAMDAIIGRISGIAIENVNNKISIRHIGCTDLLYDSSASDMFDRRFAGYIRYMTPDEILTTYDLKRTVYDEIIQMAEGKVDKKWSIGAYDFNWSARSDGRLPVVTLYWRTLLEPEFNTNDDVRSVIGGIDSINKLDYIYRCDCVGGKLIIKKGHVPNIVRDLHGRAMLPIIEFRASAYAGVLSCPVDMMKSIVDRLDAIENTITTKYARDMGRVYAFIGQAFKNASLPDIIADFRKFGLTILPLGPDVSPLEVPKDAITLDFSADPNLERYIMIRDKYTQEMEQMLSLSELTLGTSTRYVSNMHIGLATEISKGGVQIFLQNISKAMLATYHYLLNFTRQQALFDDMMPYVYSILSQDEIEQLREEFANFGEMFTVYAKISDTIDMQAKDALTQIALAMAQNGRSYIPEDILFKIPNVRTYSELNRLLSEAIRRGDEMMQRRAQLEADMQAQMLEQQAAVDLAKQNIQSNDNG